MNDLYFYLDKLNQICGVLSLIISTITLYIAYRYISLWRNNKLFDHKLDFYIKIAVIIDKIILYKNVYHCDQLKESKMLPSNIKSTIQELLSIKDKVDELFTLQTQIEFIRPNALKKLNWDDLMQSLRTIYFLVRLFDLDILQHGREIDIKYYIKTYKNENNESFEQILDYIFEQIDDEKLKFVHKTIQQDFFHKNFITMQ